MVCDIQGVGVRYTDLTVHTQVSTRSSTGISATFCTIHKGGHLHKRVCRASSACLAQVRWFGPIDLGQRGFEHFFATHRCNGYDALGLIWL